MTAGQDSGGFDIAMSQRLKSRSFPAKPSASSKK
jgi:hypothetical protein